MKKTYQFLVVLAAMLFSSMNVSADEVSLQDVPFWAHEAGCWGLEEPKNNPATPAWVIGESTGQPYGDTAVNAFADLSGYDKLVITVTDGTPRIMLNRDQDEGQASANEADAHLIQSTTSGWSDKYFSKEGNVYTVDLKQILNDKGFVHLHAIKSGAWGQEVTIESMILIRTGKEKQVGWINILTNSNLEGDDLQSFPVVTQGGVKDGAGNDVQAGTVDPIVEEGAGVDGGRGIVMTTMVGAPEDWTTQFFVFLPEVLPVGTEWRFSMDIKSDPGATVGGSIQAAPRNWLGGSVVPEFTTSPEWTTVKANGTITQEQFEKKFQSIAFDLNRDRNTETVYNIDNIKFEIYKYGTTAEFYQDNVQVDFGFETNIAALCKAAGKNRVLFPNETAKVRANGKEIGITSVEGYADGRFYIYIDEPIDDNAEVQVIFNNPAGDMQLKYAGGPNAGNAIPAVDEIADFNEDLTNTPQNDVYPYTMLPPSIKSATPEQGSFNIKNGLKEFKVTFDKLADLSEMTATLDGTPLTFTANGLVEEVTLNYAGADMEDGLHSITLSKIYPEDRSIDAATDTTYVFSVGAPDPNDVAIELIPASYFNTCAANSVPEGFLLYADGMEERVAGGSYGGGARMFSDFGDGGDFTHGLYMRSNYLTYGLNDETHRLTMEVGKPYTLTFNAARWKSSGEFLKVQLFDEFGEEVYFDGQEGPVVVTCNPDVNGTKPAIKNSTACKLVYTPDVAGDYELRFVVANNAEGEDAGETWHELLLGNVKFGYIPSAFGVVEMMTLNEELEKAQGVQEKNAGERYVGEAQTAQANAVATVGAEKDNYTSPSACNAAIELLQTTSENLTNHVALCNEYDQLIKDGADVVRQNENPSNTGVPTKFVKLDLFAQVKTVVDKYHGVSEMLNDGTEEEPNWQKHYTFDELTDDATLTTAIAELSDIVNTTKKLFTTGASVRGTTGVAALVERLRLGAETLKVLDPENPAIQEALDALDDEDAIAEGLKNNIKVALYNQLKDAGNTMFAPNDETGETPTYDMSVFVKNPNLYSREYTQEVPGWNILKGNPTAWTSWDGNVSHNTKTAFVEDCCIYLGWHSQQCVEQTIEDLPAGIYKVEFNANDNSGTSTGTYVYVKTSETTELEEGAELDPEVHFAGYTLCDNQGWDKTIANDIVVADGKLTLGFMSGSESQPFLEYVHLYLKGAADVDYTELLGQAVDGVQSVNTATVRALELYDLNGQRVPAAKKGSIYVVKKYMSDGTVKAEKVVK